MQAAKLVANGAAHDGSLTYEMTTAPAERTARERDLYETLLELGAEAEPRALVASILELLVAATGAARGFLALYPSCDDPQPRWTISHGCSPEQEHEIRVATSRGIVATAQAADAMRHVPYASLKGRCAAFASVRDQRQAVMRLSVGNVVGGVLYLEGQRGAGPFSERSVRLAEQVAKYLGPSLPRLARAAELGAVDPTRQFRQRLELGTVIGRSAALATVFEQLAPYVPLDVTLLITGANGTGKTQLAHAIHGNSHRRAGPFVELNCSAIPEGLIESELFGTMPGAFPGARRMAGKVEAAEGGTLFLDEIVEIPITAQGKLLQLLQSRQYHALGSNKLATANVRLIAATNVDLPALVAARRFREDLFYRINVVNIRMPSLAERRDDIGPLVDELIVRIAREHNLAALPASEQLRGVLEALDWPGNIRELRSKVEAALIKACAEGSPQLEVRHVAGQREPEQPISFHDATRAYQRELLRRELVAQGWNVAAVARRLDVARAHVYSLIQQFQLRRERPHPG